jgi:predicted peptidase
MIRNTARDVTVLTCMLLLLAACSPREVERRPADVADSFHSTRPTAVSDEPVDMGYLLFLPQGYADDPDTTYPLMIYLHGAMGSDYVVDVEALREQIRRPLPLDQRPDDFPFIVLMPQSLPGVDFTDELDVLNELLDMVLATYRVDESRIYLTGFSDGGAAVWGWGAYSPDRFAALVPIAGYWNLSAGTNHGLRICSVKDLSVWVAHSRQDATIPITAAEEMISGLEVCRGSGEVVFERYGEVSHVDTLFRALEDVKLYRWLSRQSRGS